MPSKPEVTYYASEENMMARMDGSKGVEWLEVRIIGRMFLNDSEHVKFVLVETLDGAKRFTANEKHVFTKTKGSES